MMVGQLARKDEKDSPLFHVEFVSSIGVICNHYFISHLIDSKVVYYSSLKRISVKKRRKLTLNYIFLFFFLVSITLFFTLKTSPFFDFFLGLSSFVFLGLFFFWKQYEYALFFIDTYLNIFVIKVPKRSKDELKRFVRKVDKKIKRDTTLNLL